MKNIRVDEDVYEFLIKRRAQLGAGATMNDAVRSVLDLISATADALRARGEIPARA